MTDQPSIRILVRRKQLIDRRLDALYATVSELGKQMGELIGTAAGDSGKSQLRNLEAVVAAATRTSALKNHIKNQTGKDRGKNQTGNDRGNREERRTWARPLPGGSLGEKLLSMVEGLGGHATVIVKQSEFTGAEEERREWERQVEIELQRGVVHTLVCTALYGQSGASG